ncbi:hypothetical protein [Mesorhizobium sp. M0491]|uniref:hypothetical protein n=1 Tax=Mesorhizobium sp. M0491 TaxID=2956950 RepID=UPI00333CEC8C
MNKPTEYEFTLPDGSKRFEIVIERSDAFTFQKMHKATAFKPVDAPKARHYIERDGGDWYIVTETHDSRLAEGFRRRPDAVACLAWLNGARLPENWSISDRKDRHCDIDCAQGYPATLWTRDVCAWFPARADEVQP